MTIPASIAYLFIPAGLVLISIGLWPAEQEEKWWQIWRWPFPENLYFIFPGIGLVASGLDFAIFRTLPVWGK
ncbi:hypothetical protein [Thioclava sp. F36-6]|uniref:hypothetical protein n=1 Tax=Thioclava sp. F36-6 TaxID=1915316 RepID=UPI0009970DE8|nr:hypothetical protein [Thioclava sp. F36-6]OOY31971.1 hypothetical protein BMI88_13085 [Thioclava sp. F36-6]